MWPGGLGRDRIGKLENWMWMTIDDGDAELAVTGVVMRINRIASNGRGADREERSRRRYATRAERTVDGILGGDGKFNDSALGTGSLLHDIGRHVYHQPDEVDDDDGEQAFAHHSRRVGRCAANGRAADRIGVTRLVIASNRTRRSVDHR